MAKFEDYAKARQQTEDSLEQEIGDAAKATDERREEAGSGFELPERFRGKTAEDIARSYVELESLNSRQAQDLGRMRKTVDDLLSLELQRSATTRETPTEHKPVTVDEIYEKPDEAIRKVVREETSARVENLEQELANERLLRAQTSFNSKFPEWQTDVQSPAFVEWIKAKPHRIALAQRADRGDFGAAEELFGTYYDYRDVAAAKAKKEERKQQARAVALESPGAEVPEQVETLSRTTLMEKRIAAKRGDYAAKRWLSDNAERIAIAYEERRIVD